MNLYKITFDNKGNLTNPKIDSPTYVKSGNHFDALRLFFDECSEYHGETQLRPDGIKCEKLARLDEIINLFGNEM